MATTRTPVRRTNTASQQMTAEDKAGIAAGVGGAVVSGAGGVTVSSCPADDQSFYCKFVRGFNIFKMILFIVVILVIVYVLYKMFWGGAKRR